MNKQLSVIIINFLPLVASWRGHGDIHPGRTSLHGLGCGVRGEAERGLARQIQLQCSQETQTDCLLNRENFM